MSAFSIRKQPPKQSDNKSPSVAIKSRQQVIQDINKRRTLLQDNSWIKKRSEEESADENYGRAVLNQYKSQDSLHSSTNEKEDQRALLGRYRSDTTLDRIPAGSDVDKINKFPTLDNKQSNRQSWTPTTSSTNTAATSPIKKKRQSWMPPPVSSCKTTTDTVETKETSPSENSEVPTVAAFSSVQVTPQKSKTDTDDQAITRGKDFEELTEINTAAQKNGRQDCHNLLLHTFKIDQDLGDHTEITPAGAQSKKGVTEQVYENAPSAPNNLPTNYSSNSERKSSYNTSASCSNPRDTGVYTRTFEENSKSSQGAYEENITGNTIKTVYSTSDRSIIGKDICTYCRKPLGIDAKMILDALQICCHSACFKCEICKRPLKDLKAGDSIWIYRQTVHCEPCYSKVREKWIY
ncbi:sciellin isoform X2 [Dromaius novaehollandiae]|uniref:sciellin isoform X2 n=1 Tax=Dromaius novaehollandiae TaxID=8790 RepID=UPI00311E2962